MRGVQWGTHPVYTTRSPGSEMLPLSCSHSDSEEGSSGSKLPAKQAKKSSPKDTHHPERKVFHLKRGSSVAHIGCSPK